MLAALRILDWDGKETAKVFLCHVIGWWVAFGDDFKTKTYFFYTMVDEDAKHRFIICPVAKAIWVVKSQIRTSIIGSILSPFKWVFIDDKAIPVPSYQVAFDYFRYWGMWFNWTTRNGFLFDGLRGVTQ